MSLGGDLGRLFADWATSISKRAIDADPDLRLRLLQLEGRSIELALTAPAMHWHLRVSTGAVEMHPGKAESPNVIVTGSAIDLINWLFRQDATGVRIEGDDTTLLETLAVLRTYDPHMQDALNSVLGEDLSQRVAGGAEAGLRGVQSLLQAFTAGLEQHTDEKFVKRDTMDEFLDNIDELRLRIDRLAANIKSRENPP